MELEITSGLYVFFYFFIFVMICVEQYNVNIFVYENTETHFEYLFVFRNLNASRQCKIDFRGSKRSFTIKDKFLYMLFKGNYSAIYLRWLSLVIVSFTMPTV